MELKILVDTLQKIPAAYHHEVKDFMDFIIEKKSGAGTTATDEVTKWKRGALKGIVTYMAPDFDEPLEGFKDYM